jgi:hypothetical protein
MITRSGKSELSLPVTLENGNDYKITNKNGAVTFVRVAHGVVYGLNGANCGKVSDWYKDVRYGTLTIVKVSRP